MINQTLPCAHALRRAVALVCQAPRPSRTKDQRLGAFSGVASRSGPSDPRALLVALARSGASPYHGFPPRPRQRGSAPGLRLLTNHFSPIRRALCLLRAGLHLTPSPARIADSLPSAWCRPSPHSPWPPCRDTNARGAGARFVTRYAYRRMHNTGSLSKIIPADDDPTRASAGKPLTRQASPQLAAFQRRWVVLWSVYLHGQ